MQNTEFIDGPDDFEDSEIDIRTYLNILRKRRSIILTVTGLTFLLSLVATYTAQPIYQAYSQVLLERNQGKSHLESNYYYYEPEFLDTQAEIIKSENVAKKVVASLLLATRYRHYFFNEHEQEAGVFGLLKDKISENVEKIKSFFSTAKDENSNSTNGETITFESKTDEEIIAEIIRGGLTVVPLKNTKIVTISYQDRDPAIAKLVVDAVVKAYMDEMLDIKLSTSNYSLKWMTSKAAEERDKLERSERELQRFKRENDLVTVENRLTILPQKLSEFGGQLSKAEAQNKEYQDLLEQIKSANNDPASLEKIPVFASDEVLKNIRERIYKARQNIQELSKKYGRKHPVMIAAKDELSILRKEKKYEIGRIVSTIENSNELAVSKKKSLQELLGRTKSETLNLNEKFMQYSIMKREVDSNRVLYDTLQATIKQQGVTEQSQSVNIWVIKKASLPLAPSKPNKKRNLLLGLLLGLGGGIALGFLIEYLDNTLTSVQQIEERFGLTVLGAIEELKDKHENIDSYVRENPLSSLAESYRLVSSALLLSSADCPPKVTLITSMNKSEGKTATLTNLARVLALGKKRVLVIDCDLRRPRMHILLDMPNEVGLSSYLAGNIDKCPVQDVPEEGISLIPSGPIPPDPYELLGSQNMKTLIDELVPEYDFILLDSPPIGSVTDSLSLSQYVDGTILVVKAGSTTNEMFEGGVKRMRDINGRILGVVLNSVKMKDQAGYQYGYSTYYAKDDD